jgi:hypothetical protein
MGKLEYGRLVFDTRLWKWLASSSPIYGNGCATQSYSLCNCVLQIVQLRLTAYGNGWQAVLPFMETVVQPSLTACVIVSYKLYNCVLLLMEMAGKQFSLFMEQLVNCVLLLVEIAILNNPTIHTYCITYHAMSLCVSFS